MNTCDTCIHWKPDWHECLHQGLCQNEKFRASVCADMSNEVVSTNPKFGCIYWEPSSKMTSISVITDKDIADIPKNVFEDESPETTARISDFCDHYRNREKYKKDFEHIESGIRELFKWKLISYPAEAEFIEATIRNTESKNVLEVGMHTGFSTLHMIRAVLPHGGKVTAIDVQRVFPEDVFKRYLDSGVFRFVQGHTPEIIDSLRGEVYDLVFMDSDHSPEHTEKELQALLEVTKSGTVFLFHDLPRIQRPGGLEETDIRQYMRTITARNILQGCILPSCYRVDMAIRCGKADYDRGVNPHMGVYVRP